MVQSLWKVFWWFLGKLTIELLHDLAIPLQDIMPRITESRNSNKYLLCRFSRALIMKYHRLGSLNNRNLFIFFTVLVTGSGIKVPAGLGPPRPLFWVCTQPSSPSPHTVCLLCRFPSALPLLINTAVTLAPPYLLRFNLIAPVKILSPKCSHILR